MRRFPTLFLLIPLLLMSVIMVGATSHAMAQDATPAVLVSRANHPLVGTWIVDRNPDDPSEIPTYNVFTADGGVIDPTVGGAGVWEPTGPDTADFTLTGTIAELGAYFVVRGTITVDAAGNTATNTYSSTIVAADGTILEDLTQTHGAAATYVRVQIEPQDAVGPIAGFPAWTPDMAATPTS